MNWIKRRLIHSAAGNNGRLVDDGNNQQQKPIALSSANDSNVNKIPTTTTTPGGYMTLPLNKSSVTMSGNRQAPAIDQGHFLRRVTMSMAHLSSHSPIITRNSSAHCRDIINNNTTTVHLLNSSSSFNFWCLAIWKWPSRTGNLFIIVLLISIFF
jgi:hypothetical protein